MYKNQDNYSNSSHSSSPKDTLNLIGPGDNYSDDDESKSPKNDEVQPLFIAEESKHFSYYGSSPMHNSKQSESEGDLYKIGEMVDCEDSHGKWTNAEIVAMRNKHVKVHFSCWSSSLDEWLPEHSDRIQKQWRPGDEFRVNNRLDVLDYLNEWLEAIITKVGFNTYEVYLFKEVSETQIQVHFVGYKSKYDEALPINSSRIAEIGTYSGAYGRGLSKYKVHHREEEKEEEAKNSKTNQRLRKRLQELRERENAFKDLLKKKQMKILNVEGDGNCLFRSVGIQLYGSEASHAIIRDKCMDYLSSQREFFTQFIEGGNIGFHEYIAWKRQLGVWGDDIEIQALSEMYSRPIQIYAYHNEPMRTFHEGISLAEDVPPIRLSYHCKSHYNAIICELDAHSLLLKSPCGIMEENSIKRAIKRGSKKNQKVEEKEPEIMPNLEIEEEQNALKNSRETFEKIGRRNMDIALFEQLQFLQEDEENSLEAILQETRDKFENEMTEEQLLKKAMEESIHDINEKEQIEKKYLDHFLEESKKEYEKAKFQEPIVSDLPEAISLAIEQGFTLEEATQAYSIVGNDPDMVLNYLFSLSYD